jgi:DNA polymerase I-like protein with 3'-5' exonuclease and polymerase domains
MFSTGPHVQSLANMDLHTPLTHTHTHSLTHSLTYSLTHSLTHTCRFGAPKLKKDGAPSKALHVPELDALQRSDAHLANWIDYSAMDAVITWRVRDRLQNLLEDMPWNPGHTMFDYYLKYWRPFGELLTDMERAGIYLDKEHLRAVEVVAEQVFGCRVKWGYLLVVQVVCSLE